MKDAFVKSRLTSCVRQFRQRRRLHFLLIRRTAFNREFSRKPGDGNVADGAFGVGFFWPSNISRSLAGPLKRMLIRPSDDGHADSLDWPSFSTIGTYLLVILRAIQDGRRRRMGRRSVVSAERRKCARSGYRFIASSDWFHRSAWWRLTNSLLAGDSFSISIALVSGYCGSEESLELESS